VIGGSLPLEPKTLPPAGVAYFCLPGPL
jgi:hypothetical protein